MTSSNGQSARNLLLAVIAVAVAVLVAESARADDMMMATKAKQPHAAPAQPMMADEPEAFAPAHNWAGFYGGALLGVDHGLWTFDFYRNNNHGHTEQGEDGLGAGILVGYNMYWSPRIIAGLEADWGLSTASQHNNIYDDDTSKAAFHSTGSLRGRLGYLIADRWLIYGTAGLAFADISNEIQKGRNAGEQVVWDNQEKTGYAVGGGVEYAISERWTTRGEYLYENFGTVTMYNTDGNQANFNNQLHQVRVGLSYKF